VSAPLLNDSPAADAAIAALAAMLEDAVERLPRLGTVDADRMTDYTRDVSRRAWSHGEVRCPGCGLPLSSRKDLVEALQAVDESRSHAVIVRHDRCAATARLNLVEGAR
jgi:hypothetical protein